MGVLTKSILFISFREVLRLVSLRHMRTFSRLSPSQLRLDQEKHPDMTQATVG